jgi:FkbM family methyltransferase
MSKIRRLVKTVLNHCGFDIRRLQPYVEHPYRRFFREKNIDCVFDIGANIGQSLGLFRSHGFSGPIYAFEPVSHLFEKLNARVATEDNVKAISMAVGDIDGTASVNVSAGHGGASSILSMTERMLQLAPDQAVIRSEEVPIHTIDWLCDAYYPKGNSLFIKLDVQGFEKKCIVGAKKSLHRVAGIKAEMSFVPNYLEESTLTELLPLLYSLGYAPVFIEEGWRNPDTGELLQCDIWFQRQN